MIYTKKQIDERIEELSRAIFQLAETISELQKCLGTQIEVNDILRKQIQEIRDGRYENIKQHSYTN